MTETPATVFPIALLSPEREAIRAAREAGATTLIVGLPWDMIAPHEAQARRNHGGQSLRRLAERGGLCASEAVAVLRDQPYRAMSEVEAQFRLSLAFAKHTAAALCAEEARLPPQADRPA